VEIGTGTGVSGVWLLRGMNAEGVLTSVDVEAEHQRHAREVFAAEGIAPSRTRLITDGRSRCCPGWPDASYDLVMADGAKDEYPDYVEQAARLLRPGGLLAVDNALWHDRLADPAQRDPDHHRHPRRGDRPGRGRSASSRRCCRWRRPARGRAPNRLTCDKRRRPRSRGSGAVVRAWLTGDRGQLGAEVTGLVGGELDDEASAALQRDAHGRCHAPPW